MNIDHNFNVGQPDNLVFINEFLDKIEAKLEQLVCLYCEKVFKSRDVLKEHMRKKGHKKLNPKNKMWDKYYLVNYLEFGKTWEDVAREDHERAFSEDLPSGWDHQEVRINYSVFIDHYFETLSICLYIKGVIIPL